ncbi:MAG: hypothetical protein Q8R28_15200 [Dehalococcoidia bacterium]|nr:hypothetical protein [Dehalococcoidia bacterium]
MRRQVARRRLACYAPWEELPIERRESQLEARERLRACLGLKESLGYWDVVRMLDVMDELRERGLIS